MSKKFDIHEWQAKQRQQRLNESDKFGFASGDNYIPDRVEKYNGLPIRDNVMDYANEILNQINDYENNVGPGEQMINYNATREAVKALMNAVDKDEEGMMNEHHAGDYKPGFLKQSVNTFLDKLKKKTNEGPDYETVEKIMEKHFSAKKEVDENTLGTGTSFNAGSGEGYMTPNAFKKKKKK